MGLTWLSLYTPPTTTTRNSNSTRKNGPRGLKFYMRPHLTKLTTTKHNFNPTIIWEGVSCILPLGFTLAEFFFNNIFLDLNLFDQKIFWTKNFYDSKIFWTKNLSDTKLFLTQKINFFKQKFFTKIFSNEKSFQPKNNFDLKFFLTKKNFLTKIFKNQNSLTTN